VGPVLILRRDRNQSTGIRGRSAALLSSAALAVTLVLVGATPELASGPTPPDARAASRDSVRILIGTATSLDPAAQGDIGSAAISAQLFETLTAFDAKLQVRPALAESWDLIDGGRRIVFHLRDGLTFSDGTPLGAADVVRSWLRVVNPDSPSPLVSLFGDVEGALAYARGENPDPASVGLKAAGQDVEVRLIRPASDFPAVVASPTFAVVPSGLEFGPAPLDPSKFVGSGAYVL
jgi:ABC-type transport system substrate-binding protein